MNEQTPMTAQQALAAASVPTLLMCLAQITGERRWTEAPYLPQRDLALFADPSGGLPPDVQQEVRDAMAQVLQELASGQRQLAAPPDEARALEMMRVCLGENIPPEYAGMALEEMGMRDRTVHWSGESRPAQAAAFPVLVIGAGVSGLCAAVRLQELGMPFEVVEKNPSIGGTWVNNSYPESGVDTPNHFYSYSFAPNLKWSANYSKRDEVWTYMHNVAEEHKLHRFITFETEVVSMHWSEPQQQWQVTLRGRDGALVQRNYKAVITAVGQLNRPKMAPFPGMDSFTGTWWHSALWRHDVPLKGKRVAVIGTGASAMQFLRTVGAEAAEVTVFQRSPQWVRQDPDYQGKVAPENQWLLENVPYYYPWYRFGLIWRFGDGLLPTLKRDPEWPHPERAMNARNDKHRQVMTKFITEALAGRDDLLAKCLPDYPPYGKRILVDNGWFETLKRPNVKLVTQGVDHVDGDKIVTTEGETFEADIIILGTGFEAGKLLAPMDIRGRSGTPLRAVWGDDDPRAHLGTTVHDYPNLFIISGPNTALAHGGSLMFMSECQVRYITSCLTHMVENGVDSMEVRQDVFDDYNRRVDAEHAQLVWTHPGMRNWYRNDRGRVFSPVPWRLVDFWRMTHDPDFSEYVLRRAEKAQATSEVVQ